MNSSLPRYRLSLVRESESSYHVDPPAMKPEAAVKLLWREVFEDAAQEMMVAMFLDCRQRVIGLQVAHIGTLSAVAVEPRAILSAALLCNASGVVLAHNHPSGDPTPSADDLEFTRRMTEACELLGLRLRDHLIIGAPGRWVSLARRGGLDAELGGSA